MKEFRYRYIRGGLLVDIERHALECVDIELDGDSVAAVRPDGATFDATGKLLLPGLVNAHLHGHGTLAKGLVEDRWPLELFLNALPSLTGNRATEDKYLNGLVSAVEMIRKGCTACFDLFFEFPSPSLEGIEAIGSAYRDAGVRAVLAPMLADKTLYRALPGLMEAIPEALRPDVEKIALAPYETSLKACSEIFDRWPFDRDWVRPGIAPTIPLHCSDQFLSGCDRLAREYGLVLQTHLAETKTQAVLGRRKYGRTLTAHLDALGLLGPHFSAAHAIWLDEEDLSRLADNGASVVHAPGSNLRFGSGMAYIRPMLDRRINVGIATDAANSSDNLNMFEAVRLATFVSRIQTPDYRSWLRADEVLRMATEGSARAMGFGEQIGRIAPNYKADIVFLTSDHINYRPLNDAVNQVVFTENGAAVESVMIGGRLVMREGVILTIDEKKLFEDAQRASDRLRIANAGNHAFAKKLEETIGLFCVSLCREPYHVHRYASTADAIVTDTERRPDYSESRRHE